MKPNKRIGAAHPHKVGQCGLWGPQHTEPCQTWAALSQEELQRPWPERQGLEHTSRAGGGEKQSGSKKDIFFSESYRQPSSASWASEGIDAFNTQDPHHAVLKPVDISILPPSFLLSFTTYLLRIYYIHSAALGTRKTGVNRSGKISSCGVNFLVGRDRHRIN